MIRVYVSEIEIPKRQKIYGKRGDDGHSIPTPDWAKNFDPGASHNLNLCRAHVCLRPVGLPFQVIQRHVCEIIQGRSTARQSRNRKEFTAEARSTRRFFERRPARSLRLCSEFFVLAFARTFHFCNDWTALACDRLQDMSPAMTMPNRGRSIRFVAFYLPQ